METIHIKQPEFESQYEQLLLHLLTLTQITRSGQGSQTTFNPSLRSILRNMNN